MRRASRAVSVLGCAGLVIANSSAGQPAASASAQGAGAKTTEPPSVTPDIRDQLRKDAGALKPLFPSPMVQRFLDATRDLPDPGARVVWRSADKTRAYSQAEYDALPESERAGLTKREFPPAFYYTTAFGSPLIYARPLQIAAEHGFDARGARVLDFGNGLIGHLRLLASIGATAHGVDVEPVFRALYSSPGDTGSVPPFDPEGNDPHAPGALMVHHGRWPGDAGLRARIGDGFDLFISKNVLKRGYVHPEREADHRLLVDLGVSDEAFVRAMHDVLKPGGLAIIYNIAPPQNPPDKPYLPHADPRCAFERALLEQAGFDVLAYDVDDAGAAIAMWNALGYFKPEEQRHPREHLFVRYTLLKRKP